MMKKFLSISLVAVLFAVVIGYCFLGSGGSQADGVRVLRVYNWEEYISEDDEDETLDVIAQFEKYYEETYGEKVAVEYSTFGTNENMYNELNLSKKTVDGKTQYSYDLVCPSEYMLLKMMSEDMLEELDHEKLPNYMNNSSAYIRRLFKGLKTADESKTLYDYAACYMWGTMGFVINPEEGKVKAEDAKSWSLLWKDEYSGTATIKDSVRDSYIVALGYCYQEELLSLKAKFELGQLSDSEYNLALTEIYNRTDDKSIELSGKALTNLKDKLYGYEVDSGKKEMAQGKIWINFAWSGDAVYTMDVAEEDGTELYYYVPEEGSNIFFDGWAMPKGADKELAQEFIDFLARPNNACLNMDYIGYSSSIAGDEMFENAVDWYGTYVLVESDFNSQDAFEIDGKFYEEVYFGDISVGEREALKNADGTYTLILPKYDEDYGVIGASEETLELYATDLSYFFNTAEDGNEEYVLWTDESDRQAFAQYPDFNTVSRCTVMKSFSDDEIRALNNMWETAKVGEVNLGLIFIVLGIIAVLIIASIVLLKLYKDGKIFQPKTPKGWKLISEE